MNIRGFQRFLALCGIIGRAPANTADTTVGAATLSAAAFVGGFITRSGSTAAYTDTTPTITLIEQALPSGQNPINLSWMLTIKNNTSWVETLSAGTGGTLSGITVIPPYSTGTFLVTITASNAYTMVGMSIQALLTNFTEVVTAANVITPAENGATYFLALVGGFASTLPAPAMGLQFHFIVQIAPTTSYTIIAPSSATILYGNSQSSQGGASGIGTGEATFAFVGNQSAIGDYADFISDGTNWYVRSGTNLDAGITIADLRIQGETWTSSFPTRRTFRSRRGRTSRSRPSSFSGTTRRRHRSSCSTTSSAKPGSSSSCSWKEPRCRLGSTSVFASNRLSSKRPRSRCRMKLSGNRFSPTAPCGGGERKPP